MHVGYSTNFNNPGNQLPDRDVYERELYLCDFVEPLGFDSVWTVEHHFTEYNMVPDPLMFLSYMAGRTERVALGSAIIVLPWHDPIRVVENLAMLDNMCGGRLVAGVGRGLGRIEYGGFGIPMESSRERFLDYLQFVMASLEQGFMEWESEFLSVPRRDIRPGPTGSFRDRLYVASMSPDSMPIVARAGAGLMQPTTKPWNLVLADYEAYRRVYEEVHHTLAPPGIIAIPTYVDADASRAEEMAHRHFGAYNRTVIDHYEFLNRDWGPGYEFYRQMSDRLHKTGVEQNCAEYTNVCFWGTPDQVIEKITYVHELIGIGGFSGFFSVGGMSTADAERSMRLFAAEVLPEVKKLGTGIPIDDVARSAVRV